MLSSLKKYWDAIKTFSKKSEFLFKTDPYLNWILIVAIFVMINILFISSAMFKFYKISSDQALLSEGSKVFSAETINRNTLKETLLMFELRKENYEDFKINRPNFPDPSI